MSDNHVFLFLCMSFENAEYYRFSLFIDFTVFSKLQNETKYDALSNNSKYEFGQFTSNVYVFFSVHAYPMTRVEVHD